MSQRSDSSDDGRPAGFVPLAEVAARFGQDTGPDAAWREAIRQFPMRWPRRYLELAHADDPDDPIRAMGFPDPGELVPDPGDLADPVGESRVSPVPFVVQKHADRALLVVTSRCHFYCRFCFRRTFPVGEHRDPTPAELDRALDHLSARAELREVILSGGDPLVLDDDRLGDLLEAIRRRCPQVASVRVHTRAPVHYPERITPALAERLASGLPCWIVAHYNHPRELAPASREALDRLRRAGLPLLNQTVLLHGVNDDADTLVELCRELYAARVKPYYLHHPDRVPGSARFRLTVERGLALYRALRGRLPGPALPSYVIDLPDGSGKVPVEQLERLGERRYRWVAADGRSFELDDVPEVTGPRPAER